ncbi:pimeloyl-ACP methyl ester carboxylesterase [Spinactinospora alkalitolerans]|uniref:Pimeloyl-ACP methyl ester carboxylesterase n=1 Tax=Spinactinospora alkalitolerans TaxID=687207 RepID=A0A852U3L1_9ACTN|nr:alpha/beta fold hydrolase [Spinactinospora alkalitolerans]NYE50771.1 pimeloyl-ACP methyl ester carboxylesterase [Spinactinospora alkalitolerans]
MREEKRQATEQGPWLAASEPREVRAVALLLHGGQVTSTVPTGESGLAVRRMRPFAAALTRARHDRGLAVWRLRNRVRGWNGAAQAPLHDARWALAEVRRRHGSVPVVLIGHSLGGRVALRAAGDALVRGVVGLAPWLPEGEPTDQISGRHVVLAHGLWDLTTSPRATRAHAERIRPVAASSSFVPVRFDLHAMVRLRTWNRLVVESVSAMLDERDRGEEGDERDGIR